MTPDENSDALFLNGIDGSTGEYLPGPASKMDLARIVRGETDPAVTGDLRNRKQLQKDHYGPISTVDPQKLDQAGWGVLLAQGADPAILEQLRPLLELRKEQAGALYREYAGDRGYKPGTSKFEWTKGATGPVDPKHIPYYLLIVGDPDTIPYQFQFQLDIQYAVGRIHFDHIEDYGRYASYVAAAESGKIARPKKAAYFGVTHQQDMATYMSWNFLAKPLAEQMDPSWQTDVIRPEEAKKARLATLMGGAETPAFLFTTSHGIGYPLGDERQYRNTGALQCGDYPGPGRGVPFGPDCYFAADDLGTDANLAGLVAFFFACYGAGTPKFNSFPMKDKEAAARQLAAASFVANLPKRMLAQGALAVVGHVDRAWSYSMYAPRTGGQNTSTFRSTVDLLLNKGSRLGFAMEPFNGRYAEMSSELVENSDIDPSVPEAAELLTFLWTCHNDARNYAVVGDPAVRLCAVDGPGEEKIDMPLPAVITSAEVPTAKPEVSAAQEIARAGVDSFSWGESKEAVSDTLQQVREKLAAVLDRTLTNLSTLEVVTYTSDNSTAVDLASGAVSGAQQKAVTRVDLTGQTQSSIPTRGGAVDEPLWKLHMEMVERAMAHRAAMWKFAAEVAGQAVGWLKKV